MYIVGSRLPVDEVDPGSTLLVVGPPMTGKRELVLSLLAEGFDEQGVGVVSTDAGASDIRDSLAAYTTTPADELPLGVVDCMGDSHGSSGLGPLDSRVSSPADLTGIGMNLTNLLERLYTDHAPELRVGVLSLTTMSMYVSPEQVIRFLHAITGRIREAEALGLVVAHSDTMDTAHLQRLRSFVDGVVEVREREEDSEIRVRGIAGAKTEWTPFERQQLATTAAGQSGQSYPSDVPVADSLGSIFDDIRGDSPTLTVVNHSGEQGDLDDVERYFDRHGVEVREASLDVKEPRSVALLHHHDNLLGSETVTALSTAIDIESEAGETVEQRERPDLLTKLDQSVFGAAAADKGLLIDASHTIELLAARTGAGRISAGFQNLSNLVDYDQAARIYERLAESDVDVHVFGTPDTTTTIPDVTLHKEDNQEIRDSWFVSYDGNGNPERKAALLAIERDDGETFEGFWTYDDDIVNRINAYLTETYIDGPAVGEQSAD